MMGQHHLRICSGLSEVELVAVVDLDENKARKMADCYSTQAFSNVAELINTVEVDAAIIAVPSVLHLEVGRQCLSNNIHCLIEKPLAITEAECRELMALAEKNQLILLVGHVERFNAAVQQLFKEILNKRNILAIHAERLNLNQQRLTDVDVILDLMTHDLDIILSLMKAPITDCSAKIICTVNENEADFATALISFLDGTIVNITASRITQKKVRKLEVLTDAGFYTLDFLTQEIWFHRDASQAEQIAVHKQDALTAEILNFVHSVQSGEALGVTAQDALETLKLVWQLQEKGRSAQKTASVNENKILA